MSELSGTVERGRKAGYPEIPTAGRARKSLSQVLIVDCLNGQCIATVMAATLECVHKVFRGSRVSMFSIVLSLKVGS